MLKCMVLPNLLNTQHMYKGKNCDVKVISLMGQRIRAELHFAIKHRFLALQLSILHALQ